MELELELLLEPVPYHTHRHHYCHRHLNPSQTFHSMCVQSEPVLGGMSDSEDLENMIPALHPVGLF